MKNIKFIDLFCGLGGFRIALEKFDAQCVFSAEINSHACKIYEENFGENPFCDVSKISPYEIPDFDIMCAGFPCQAFSIAGKKKGFEDTRGTLFFDLCRIIDVKRPKILLLENVKHLTKHDNGNTFKTILSSLESLNYEISYQVLNAKDFGVAQSRERIIIVGVNKEFSDKKFVFEDHKIPPKNIKDILKGEHEILSKSDYTILEERFVKKQKSGLIFCGYRNKNIRLKGVRDDTMHLSRVHKQPNRIYHIDGVHPTLSSQEASGRYFVFNGKDTIKLNMDDCFNLMGFPQNYKKIGSQSNLYNRIGNSVCVPMIEYTMKSISKQILDKE